MTERSLPFRCKCGARWNGLKTAHCGARGCHKTFTTVSSFDLHRSGTQQSRVCVEPEKVGLEDAGRSYPCWGHPSDGKEWE